MRPSKYCSFLFAFSLLLSVFGCSHSSMREDQDLISAFDSVKLPGGWMKNPPGFGRAVYSATFSDPVGAPWRSALVVWEGELSAAEVKKRGALQPGERLSDRYPPVKTATHVGDFCADIEFQHVPKANRNTPLTLFECGRNYASLDLIEYGQARTNDITRNALIRVIGKKFGN